MGCILVNPKFTVFNEETNEPMSGACVYFYETGTTTKKTIYSDRACTTPQSNPVTLDSRGEASVYGVGQYKVVVNRPPDVSCPSTPDDVVWTSDPVDGIGGSFFVNISDYGGNLKTALTAIGSTKTTLVIAQDVSLTEGTSIPATLELFFGVAGKIILGDYNLALSGVSIRAAEGQMIFSLTGTGDVTGTIANSTVPVNWFGVNTTPGTTSMETAIEAAYSVAASSSNILKFIPGQIYATTDLTFSGAGAAATPAGIDFGGCELRALAGTSILLTLENIHLDNERFFITTPVYLNGNNIAASCLKIHGGQRMRLAQITAEYATSYGIRLDSEANYGLYYSTFDFVSRMNGGHGVYATSPDSSYRNAANVFMIHASQNKGVGLYADYFQNKVTLIAESNDSFAAAIYHTRDLTFVGGYSENNHENIATDGASDGTTDTSFYFSKDALGVKIEGGRHAGEIQHLYALPYTSGSEEPTASTDYTAASQLQGAVSGVKGYVDSVTLTSGTWAGGDAAGTIYVYMLVGNAEAWLPEALNIVGGTADIATATGACTTPHTGLFENTTTQAILVGNNVGLGQGFDLSVGGILSGGIASIGAAGIASIAGTTQQVITANRSRLGTNGLFLAILHDGGGTKYDFSLVVATGSSGNLVVANILNSGTDLHFDVDNAYGGGGTEKALLIHNNNASAVTGVRYSLIQIL